MKLLVVEDDKGLANGIAFSMERDGHTVFLAGTLKKAWDILAQKSPDAVLLDLNLPDGDGIAFCRSLREQSQIPVVMLTARDMETDEVQGLLSGADDYLTKPFSLAVLKARLDTVLRRSRAELKQTEQGDWNSTYESAARFDSELTYGSTDGRAAKNDSDSADRNADGFAANEYALAAGEIRLVPGRMKVYRGEREIECSATEYRLLHYLMENRGQVLLKEQILEHVWDSTGSYVDENTLQVTVRRLRRKLENDPSNPDYIQTVHGLGYMFAAG